MNIFFRITLIIFIFNGNIKADHYNKGGWFEDPYVQGCLYDLLDSSFGRKCAYVSPKYYFHEGKHKGSLNMAYKNCYDYLKKLGYKKYRDFNDEDYSIECNEIG